MSAASTEDPAATEDWFQQEQLLTEITDELERAVVVRMAYCALPREAQRA